MEQHVKRFTHFQESGSRLLPPPPMYDLDPVIPPYPKFGQEGHLYIVKPPGLDEDQFVFKIGSTTQLLKRMYWYEPGTELKYSIHIPNSLRSTELQWIESIRRDKRFTLVKGREYFSGPWEEAIKILDKIRETS
jgi:T5orf172 domain